MPKVNEDYPGKKSPSSEELKQRAIKNYTKEEKKSASPPPPPAPKKSTPQQHKSCAAAKTLWDKQNGRCALSGAFMTWHKGGEKRNTNVSIDRIDPNIEYVLPNIQLVCWRVNLIKHTMTEDELYWWCKNIVTHKEKF